MEQQAPKTFDQQYIPPKHVREAIEELTHKEAKWVVNPRSLFAGVIIVVAVTAGLMVTSLYIGKDLEAKSPSVTPTQTVDLGPMIARLEHLTRTVSMLSKQPQEVNLSVPKEALKMEITLPQAPPPQPLHIHTKEMRTTVKELIPPLTPKNTVPIKKKAPEPAPVKKAEKPAEYDTSALDRYKGPLPPPRDTKAWNEWFVKYGRKVKEKNPFLPPPKDAKKGK
jgi:hypothetical protein